MKLNFLQNNKILLIYFIGLILLPLAFINLFNMLNIDQSLLNVFVNTSTYVFIFISIIFIINKSLLIEGKIFLSSKKNILNSLFTALALLVSYFIIAYLFSVIGVKGTSNNQSSLDEIFKIAPTAFIITTVILAPFVEEIVYRKVLFSVFKARLNKIFGILISSFFFGFIHVTSGDFVYLPMYFSLGIILAYSYSKTNNIFVAILGHSIYNLVTILLMY
ncbi:type II CAAX endopeptidase family protein [Mycoplasmatota bacterium WC44]